MRTSRKFASKRQESIVRSTARSEAVKVIREQGEEKFHDVLRAFTGLSYAGFIEDLTAISQGTADSNRIGDKLTPKRMEIRLNVPDALAGTFRFIIFRWKATSVPIPGDILKPAHVNTQYAPLAPYFHDQRSQFNILYDSGVLSQGSVNASKTFTFNKSMKMANKDVKYTAAGTAGSGKIYLLSINDGDPLISSPPQLSYIVRLTYTDK